MNSKRPLDSKGSNNIPPAVSIDFRQDKGVLRPLLKKAGLDRLLRKGHSQCKDQSKKFKVLIKPNLVNDSPFPITTPVWLVKGLVEFIRSECSQAQIIIGEGTGEPHIETDQLFRLHGYSRIEGVEFIDFNYEECIEVDLPQGRKWSRIFLPAVLFDVFLISVPVLKAHTLAGVTLSMKNMIGVCPPAYFAADGVWRKSAFHQGIQEAIFDLNQARCPDFCLLDATVGMSQGHLSGPVCDPPVDKLVAGQDPVAVDAIGAELLGRDWRSIGHISLANGVLGNALSLGLSA